MSLENKQISHTFSYTVVVTYELANTKYSNSVLASFKKRQGALSPSPSRDQVPVPPSAATQA